MTNDHAEVSPSVARHKEQCAHTFREPQPDYNKIYIVQELEHMLKLFSDMPAMSPAGTTLGEEEHKQWMATREKIKEMQMDTHNIALLALPPDIRQLYDEIEKQRCRVLNIVHWTELPSTRS